MQSLLSNGMQRCVFRNFSRYFFYRTPVCWCFSSSSGHLRWNNFRGRHRQILMFSLLLGIGVLVFRPLFQSKEISALQYEAFGKDKSQKFLFIELHSLGFLYFKTCSKDLL